MRKDYITWIFIIIIEKYGLNNEPKFIDYETYKKELNNAISIMTGKVKINTINEIMNCLETIDLDIEENNDIEVALNVIFNNKNINNNEPGFSEENNENLSDLDD